MRSIALIALLTGWFCCVGSALADTEAEIKAALDYYAEVWNEGDLETIRGYYHSDFVLVTPQGPVSLAQRNADIESITRSGEDRGELSYSGVKVRPLGDDHALAWGELRLAFKDGSSIDSWFSTVYVKTPFGWKAVLTHQ
jgi:ketosteroid isomerase-like protein